ncbi:uncharacterized protein KY384_001105 [Bacidia gigantensis]|uniref:uncharacterized protein n=1 Tax=Bacidia gigantensis TaxID=2732470 RepID=UPI001D04FCFB|nr:uncharacterized protein KY384_001105 [Bacidia gigantensis]KAG8534261.1 hypothetical protein KY384_001105 [Bacidia gigantensis]
MTTIATSLPSPQPPSAETLSTLPDPRTPLTPPDISRSGSTSPHHPELSNEVAALSNKLIHAINHQTDLDDTLSETRQQLEAAQERVWQLEQQEQEHRSLIDNRILVKWEDVEQDTLRLRVSLADERKQRAQVAKDKAAIEQELETLTTELFEEANKVRTMVALHKAHVNIFQMVSAAKRDAKRDREGIEKRNEQLQAQLNDAELLLSSHQEQLAELKHAMQDMSAHRNELETVNSLSTAPSTPALDSQEHISRIFDALHLSPTTPGGDDIPPAPPTHFTHLISPVLRTDVQAFEDFHFLLDVSRRSGPPSRVTSGNYNGSSGLGITNLSKGDSSQLSNRMPSNGSTSSLTTSNTLHSSPSTPNLAPSATTSVSSRDGPTSGTPLKETAFYKRVLVEDIEPTMRLDTAPGLSWLARRSVVSSMCEGRLVVEPMPVAAKGHHNPCSLCGEQGRNEQRVRTHRFRLNESETAQRYPLCDYCLNRVRSTCDLIGFLRMVKDGHWRTDGPQAEAMAWEESVRLRERMFWSRIGGGVIPAFLRGRPESPRLSIEDVKSAQASSEAQTRHGNQDMHDMQPSIKKEVGQERPPTPPPKLEAHVFSPPNHVPRSQSPSTILRARSDSQLTARSGPDPPASSSLSMEDRSAVADKDAGPDVKLDRTSLSRTTTRSRGSSRAEAPGSGNVINSIAKRAAMFERSASQDGPSNQLHASLQASMRNRSPSPRKADSSGSVPGAFE